MQASSQHSDSAFLFVLLGASNLARGYSGVREVLLERLCALQNERLLPQIPAEGSVGASGDLTPLSYLAATVVGEREVTLRGEPMPASEALAAVGLEPLTLDMDLSDAELAAPRVETKPAHGPLRHLGPILHPSETQPHWSRPTPMVGADAPEWLDAASAAKAAE